MNILVIDGQGGGIGRQLITAIKQEIPSAFITAIGTNSMAAMNMLKAGADEGASGENPVVVCCRKAAIIVGPVGIAIADSMLGEITPKMAEAVARSNAKRILIPYNHCGNVIVGIPNMSMSALIRLAVEEIKRDEASSGG